MKSDEDFEDDVGLQETPVGQPQDFFAEFKKPSEEAQIDQVEDETFLLISYGAWVTFLAILCNFVRVINFLFEAQIVM